MEQINTNIWLKIDIEELEDRKEFAMILPPVSVLADNIEYKTAGCLAHCLCDGFQCSGLSICVGLSSGGGCEGFENWIQ